MKEKRYLTAKEAAAELEISVSTVYAYVSRGLIRSEETEGKSRAKRYRRADIDALQERKRVRGNPTHAAADALDWGMPVLESALTLIDDGRFYYRGHDVLQLARTTSIEAVAGLLWMGDLGGAADLFAAAQAERPQMAVADTNGRLMDRFQVALPQAAGRDVGAYDLRAAAVKRTGARILRTLTAVAVGQATEKPIAAALHAHWRPDASPPAERLLNAALVLCADHELNVSSFTARCVASAGSPPYAVVTAGLAALQGTKHGGYTERVEALFREAETAAAETVVAGRLRRGEGIPGFGHKLYPHGDPRGRLLLDLVAEWDGDHPAVARAQALMQAVEAAAGARPTIDFGLVTLTAVLGLPPGTALGLFALGRSVGWIAHALEQYRRDQLIRPRARYTGPPPS